MSLIGSNWKEESTAEERFKDITGYEVYGDVSKEIDSRLNCSYLGRKERKELLELSVELNNCF